MGTNAKLARNGAFQQRLAFGQMAETEICQWLRSRGHCLLPVYDNEYDTGKGPRMFLPEGNERIAPDVLVFLHGGSLLWAEAKHKTCFTWYRKKQQWETGIDLCHYRDYLDIRDQLGHPIWLFFLHRSATPSIDDLACGCPPTCPIGLFGEALDVLMERESHRSQKHGRSGMVYWAHDALRKLASLDEINSIGDV